MEIKYKYPEMISIKKPLYQVCKFQFIWLCHIKLKSEKNENKKKRLQMEILGFPHLPPMVSS